jgi:hypothetical protein
MRWLLASNGGMIVKNELTVTCRGILKVIFPAFTWMSEEKH